MPLSNEEKREYQRQWVRQKRAKGSTKTAGSTVGSTDLVISKDKAIKLLKICNELDRTIPGLSGKRENMLDLVRMGVLTLREVRERLTSST